jgi:hypothetical protein
MNRKARKVDAKHAKSKNSGFDSHTSLIYYQEAL